MATDRVIVIGAGPVGLTAALALAKRNIPVLLLEAETALPRDLRASTFHPPTLDLLEQFGIVDELINLGMIASTWQFRDRETGPVATFDMGVLRNDTAHPYRLQCEQWKLAGILHRELLKVPGVEVRLGARIRSVAQTDSTASVTLEDGTTLDARYVIAADGAHSPARKALDIEFEGFTYPELFLVASTTFPFETVVPDLAPISYISDPNAWFVLLRVRDLWRVLVPVPVDVDRDAILSDASVQEVLRKIHPDAIKHPINHRTLYFVHQKVAARFAAGRVLLAGDAAHLNNPLGGMGMNGGVHDALNLVSKLEQVWHGGDSALLQLYERQRRTVTLEAVQQQTMRNHQLMSERDPEVRAKSFANLRETVADPAKAREYLLKSSMIMSLRRAESIQ